MAKKIEIEMGVKGADAAAVEIRKLALALRAVEERAKQAEVLSSRGFGGMLDNVPERAQEAAESAEKLVGAFQKVGPAAVPFSEHLGEIKDELKGASEGAESLGDNVSKIGKSQKAQAFGDLAGKVGEFGSKLTDAADKVEVFDKALAATLRKSGQMVQEFSSAASTVAIGFAAGGPAGGAVAAFVATVSTLANAWARSSTAAAAAAQKTRDALATTTQATRDGEIAANDRANALASGGIDAMIAGQNKFLADGTKELREQLRLTKELRDLKNEVLDAKDRETLAGIERDVASGVMSPDQAAAKRSGIETAATERDRRDRETLAREEAVMAAKEAYTKTQSSQNSAAAAVATETARREAEAKVEAVAKRAVLASGGTDQVFEENPRFINAERDYRTFSAFGDSRAEGARVEMETIRKEMMADISKDLENAKGYLERSSAIALTVAEQAASLKESAAEARATAKQKTQYADSVSTTVDELNASDRRTAGIRSQQRADAAARAKSGDELNGRLEAERGGLKDRSDSAADAFTAAGTRGGGRTGAALQNIGKRLADGTDRKEIARLEQEFAAATQGLSTATLTALGKMIKNLQANTSKIQNLEGQIKTLRTGK